MLTLKSTFQMLTGQLFLARPSVAQMSNDEHLLGVSGAAGVLAVAQHVSLSETCIGI
jgi:hypothetical protein